jgi:hypothetical protein
MRIFEKISRRIAITLASVMACSSFAVAPITVLAEKPGPEEIAEIHSEAEQSANTIELKNEEDYGTEYTMDPFDADRKDSDDIKTFKIHSDIEGKLHITIKGKEAMQVAIHVWKKGDQATLPKEDKTIEKDKEYDKVLDVKEGDYFVTIRNTAATGTKFQIKAAIKTTDKETKIRNAESPAKKTAKVTVKKVKDVKGYEVRFSTSKDFDKNVKTKSVKDKKITFKDKKGSIEKSGLKSGKKYYVQARTYIEKNGVKYYSDWTKSKKIGKVK